MERENPEICKVATSPTGTHMVHFLNLAPKLEGDFSKKILRKTQ